MKSSVASGMEHRVWYSHMRHRVCGIGHGIRCAIEHAAELCNRAHRTPHYIQHMAANMAPSICHRPDCTNCLPHASDLGFKPYKLLILSQKSESRASSDWRAILLCLPVATAIPFLVLLERAAEGPGAQYSAVSSAGLQSQQLTALSSPTWDESTLVFASACCVSFALSQMAATLL